MLSSRRTRAAYALVFDEALSEIGRQVASCHELLHVLARLDDTERADLAADDAERPKWALQATSGQ